MIYQHTLTSVDFDSLPDHLQEIVIENTMCEQGDIGIYETPEPREPVYIIEHPDGEFRIHMDGSTDLDS